MKDTDLSAPVAREQRNAFVQFCLFFLLIIAFYFSSVSQLYLRWIQWDQDLSHGLPTVAIFLFLLWHALPWPYRKDAKAVRTFLLILLGLASLAWFLFHKIHIGILVQVTLLCIILLFIASCYSLKTLRHVAVPCGILIFALPLWGILNGPLVEISAAVVGKTARLSGMTLLMDGSNIFIPYGRLYIDDGCSGLRYFVIGLLMAYLISYLNHYRVKQVVVAFGVAIVLSLLTNWVRIFSLVVIGYQTEMKSSLMEDHELFGWVLFALVMLPAIYYAPAFKPKPRVESEIPTARPLLPLLLLMIGPALALLAPTTLEMAPAFTLNALNHYSAAHSTGAPVPNVELSYPGLPLTYNQSVIVKDVVVRVELAQYVQTDTQEKLVPYFRSLHDRDVWSIASERKNDATGLQFSVMKRAGSENYHLLAHLYFVGRYATHQYELAKLLQIPAMLWGDNYFVIFTAQAACNDSSCAAQTEAIKQVARDWLAEPVP